ncbi:MAG: hypothetical protein IBX67_04490 [Dehalococcoidia bacterium]|nr:hypothetical protein [Dehalococcoidia bacterium]
MAEKRAVVTAHAKSRLAREKAYSIDERTLIKTVRRPDEIVRGEGSRFIAHKVLDETYILRVVYEETGNKLEIVTFYRAKKKRYYRGDLR